MMSRRTGPLSALALAFLAASGLSQLSGSYTVNRVLPASATNFTTLGAALGALASVGVSGPVVIEVYDDGGPYVESEPFLVPGDPLLGQSLDLGDRQAVMVLRPWPGGSSLTPVTIRAAAGERPVIDANGHACGVYFAGADATTLEGFEIRGAAQDAVAIYAAQGQDAVGNTIARCVIHDCGRCGVSVIANQGVVDSTSLGNNVFFNLMTNAAGGVFAGTVRDGYVASRGDGNTRVVHNTFVGTTMAATQGWLLGNAASTSSASSYTLVVGNVFRKTAALGRILTFRASNSGAAPTLPVVSDRNLFFDTSNGAFAAVGTTATPLLVADLPAWQVQTGLDAGSVAADPLFTGAGLVPWRLSPGSPAIGMVGTSALSFVVEDVDEQPRDAAPDAGADEFLPGSLPEVTRVGMSCAGSYGSPVFDATGLPRIGNSGFGFNLSAAPPGGVYWIFVAVGLAAAPLDLGGGCRVYLDLASLAAFTGSGIGPFGPVPIGGSGTSFFPLPIPPQPALIGQRFDLQAAVLDSSAALGFATTNALSCIVN